MNEIISALEKKLRFGIARMLRFAFFLGAFSVASTQASALTVTMATKVENGDKPVVVGTTNLPNGIDLMFTISRKASHYSAQTTSKIEAGAFRAGPFSEKGAPLNPGVYTLEISMALAQFQPASVLPIIGNNGSMLQGPLAKNSDLGGIGGKYVKYETSFKIGSVFSPAQKMPGSMPENAKESGHTCLPPDAMEAAKKIVIGGDIVKLPTSSKIKIIGTWASGNGVSLSFEEMSGTVYRVFRSRYCNTGSTGVAFIRNGRNKFKDKRWGDEYVILASGNLGVYDKEGLVDTYQRLPGLWPQ